MGVRVGVTLYAAEGKVVIAHVRRRHPLLCPTLPPFLSSAIIRVSPWEQQQGTLKLVIISNRAFAIAEDRRQGGRGVEAGESRVYAKCPIAICPITSILRTFF